MRQVTNKIPEYYYLALIDVFVFPHQVAGQNVGVTPGDVVHISNHDAAYLHRVRILSIEDTIVNIDTSFRLRHTFLEPYFRQAYRPLCDGDIFPVTYC